MSTIKWFLITRRNEPFLLGNSLEGAVWAHPILFERPIEKIGSVFELRWEDELFSNDKTHVVRVLAHWKKNISKRARKLNVPIESVFDISELTDDEREELLQGINKSS